MTDGPREGKETEKGMLVQPALPAKPLSLLDSRSSFSEACVGSRLFVYRERRTSNERKGASDSETYWTLGFALPILDARGEGEGRFGVTLTLTD